MTSETGERKVHGVTLYFDPACPWTWRTSRWLVDAAAAHGVPVAFAAFELAAGQPTEEVPEQYRAGAIASRLFLRGVTAAGGQGRHELIDRWYLAYGSALWEDHRDPSSDLVRQTLQSAGGSDLLAALEDTGLDDAMAAARAEAVQLAGDDVGSPVTVWQVGDHRRGSVDGGRDVVWDTVVNATTVQEFFELKSRRTNDPTSAPPKR